MTLSISDSPESYAAYADEPGDQIVGKDFEADVFSRLAGEGLDGRGIIKQPGRYGVRAHYLGRASNWVELALAT